MSRRTRHCGLLSILLATTVGITSPMIAAPREGQPISPRQNVISLFNGKDLTGWTTWLRDSGTQDSRHAYSAVDGMIRISGEGMGYLGTVDAYRDYVLHLEYRWGDRTDGSGFVRNSGILLHAVGPKGNAKGIWMTSVECQLAQGCEGDLIVIRGTDDAGQVVPATLTSDTRRASDGRTRWLHGGQPTKYSGAQFWWSNHEAGFQERLDTRGKDDVASPLGQWTSVDCRCEGDRITITINGVTVNECYRVFPAAGRILLENEGNEIYFRNIELRPLHQTNLETSHER